MVSRRSWLTALPVGAAALAWGSQSHLSSLFPVSHMTSDLVSSDERADPDPSALATAAEAVRGFTSDMYRDLAESNPEGNLVCSPLSAVMALAMARTGAMGVTAEEMDAVLHAPEPQPETLNAALNALDQLTLTAYGEDATGATFPVLACANSLWAQADLELEQAFVNVLAAYYGAGTNLVDFAGATEEARQTINAWVASRTNDRIPELLARGTVTPMTCLVLTNAIYLKASWQYPFPKEQTEDTPFLLDSGKTVTVPMMSSATNDLGYVIDDGWEAVSLPYVNEADETTAGSGLAMAVLIPKTGLRASVERQMDGDWLRRMLTAFTPTPVRLRLPRWTFRLPTDLGDLLIRLGMPTAFTNRADFSGMSPMDGLFISKVIHEAFIAVDEDGTEAAAATAVIIDRTAMATTVTADRPFLYVIYDVDTATPLFIGRVTNPAITE